jgi:serine/threonine protein kinase
MPSLFKSLTIKNLTEKQIRVIRQPSNTRPIIRLVEDNGIQGIVKDFSVNGFIYRNIIGRFLLWREGRAYQKLQGIKGIPVFYRKIDGLALVISKVPGKDLGQLSEEEKPDLEFFQRLTKLIQECHRHGIAHCDIKRSSNIIIDDFGNPHIVDWAAAIEVKEFFIYPFKIIYRRFIEDDFKAVTKLKMRYCPEGITHEEKQSYIRRSIVERTIRAVRDVARKCLQKIA